VDRRGRHVTKLDHAEVREQVDLGRVAVLEEADPRMLQELVDDQQAQEMLKAARAIDMSVLSRESISKYQGSQALLGAVPDTRLAMALQYSQTGKFVRATRPVRPSVPEWMIQTTADQLARLQGLLAKSPLNRLQRSSTVNSS
jgi:hypothetical protein